MSLFNTCINNMIIIIINQEEELMKKLCSISNKTSPSSTRENTKETQGSSSKIDTHNPTIILRLKASFA